MEWIYILLAIVVVAVIVLVLLKRSRKQHGAHRYSSSAKASDFPKSGSGTSASPVVSRQQTTRTPSHGTSTRRPLRDSDIRSQQDREDDIYLIDPTPDYPLGPVSPLYAGTYDEPTRDHSSPVGDRGADYGSDSGSRGDSDGGSRGSDSSANSGSNSGSDSGSNSGSSGSDGGASSPSD
jgi:hypothetical protein